MPTTFLELGGTGEPLHFAHANAYPPACYRQLTDALAGAFRVLALPLRPLWPDSDPAALTEWSALAGDLVDACDAQGLTGLVGVGHSMGAVITLDAAVQRPDLFRRLVLIEPVFLPPQLLALARQPDARAYLDQMPLVAATRRRRNTWPDRQAAFDHFRKRTVFERLSDESLWDYVDGGLTDAGNEVRLAYEREWEARIYALPPVEVWETIPMATQPTLAVRGALSDTLQPAEWQRWQGLQPQATFVELPGVGHLAPLEAPALLADHVLDWLAA